MKKFWFVLFILFIFRLTSNAQESNNRIKELGINLGSDFGVRYKAGNQSGLFRLTVLSLDGSSHWQKSTQSEPTRNNSQGFGLNFGFEKRKAIKENTSFYYGLDLLNSYTRIFSKYYSLSTSKYWSYSPGLGFVFGFDYNLSSKINVSAEVMPSISYTYYTNISEGQITQKYSSSSLDYGLKNSGVTLTLSYMIGK